MSRKIGFLQRWMFIINKISSTPYISKDELVYALNNELVVYDGITSIGTNVRTLERDMAEIRSSAYMDISIEYCRENKGYYIPTDEKSQSKLDRVFELSSLFSFHSLKDIVFTDKRKPRGLEYRMVLINTIRRSVEIEIEYSKYTTDGFDDRQTRRLQPYALREFKGRWYLMAREVSPSTRRPGTMKVWGLDRIRKLTICRRCFTRDSSIDLKAKFDHCFGIYTSDQLKPEKVVLSFSPLSGQYTDSMPLHESQKTLVHDENEFRIELMVKVTPDFVIELLAHSEGLTVVSPQSLKNRLIGIHKKAIEQLNRSLTAMDEE